MASPSSNICSSGSSEGDLTVNVVDPKKRKRMESNRESARRSRIRKQKHLHDLNSQVALFKKENSNILKVINMSTQHFLNVEAENSILRAQMMELSHRLESLNEILNSISCTAAGALVSEGFHTVTFGPGHGLTNMAPIALAYTSCHPIAAAPDEAMFQY
ncbi:hypothetical protein SAY86_004735 [Trapa natans]|uniref:BZIP domain-containing protein n=1 Tax=Trapa natans TaxID=22666 RepID=A0AAN7RQQ6_TRANT|nr:hypothetical protein SAY86_004735 [Trapa natans]